MNEWYSFNQQEDIAGQLKSSAGSLVFFFFIYVHLVDPEPEAVIRVYHLTATSKEVRRLWHGYCTRQQKL
jgi:hypothetical protein